MNIRRLEGSSFHSAQESRSKKQNKNDALRVTSQHPPSSSNRNKKQTNNIDHKLRKQNAAEGNKSNSFVNLLNDENRDWMIISKAGHFHHAVFRHHDTRKVDLTQSLPSDINTSHHNNSSPVDEFFSASTFENKNMMVINGKSMVVPDYLNTNEYFKQNYSKLSANDVFRTTGTLPVKFCTQKNLCCCLHFSFGT